MQPRPESRPFFSAPPHDDDDFDGQAFIEFDEVPDELLDVPPVADGDDSLLASGPLSYDRPRVAIEKAAVPFPPKARARVVPLRRSVRFGMRGKDVVAVKRALSHAGYLKWPKRWSLVAGPQWRRAVKRFQHDHGITVSGVYGRGTHRKLVQLGHFDKWGAYLMGVAPRPKPQQHLAVRDRIVACAAYWYHNRDRVSYTQTARRMTIVRRRIRKLPYRGWIEEDCSSWFTGIYYEGGATDPNRRGYDGSGYTGTLASNGHRVVVPQPADGNLYGPRPNFSHVTVAAGSRTCFSHGSDPGPYFLAIHYRTDYRETRDFLA